jgi:hypothetical protein
MVLDQRWQFICEQTTIGALHLLVDIGGSQIGIFGIYSSQGINLPF